MADISKKYEELKSAIVIERSLFEEKNDVISEFIYDKMSSSSGVIVVDKLSTFFSKTNFESLMHRASVEKDWALKLRAIGEKRGFAISVDTMNAIANFANLKRELIGELFQINSAIGSSYELADVPKNWNIETAFKFNKTTVSNGNYSIGYKTAEKIWNIVSPIWAGSVLPTKRQYVTIGSYSRHLEIHKDQVGIGCQTVKRFEVEQIALKMGWAFPE
jgi:hypothetical protein